MRCSICDKEIKPTDTYVIYINGEPVERSNFGIRVANLPTGWVHRRCKVDFDNNIVGNGRITENLENQIKDL
jgi:hypothetical protein